MTIHEIRTDLAPAEVVARARAFFPLAGSSYAAFPREGGEGHLRLHLEVGEIVIGAVREGDATRVRGSASRGAHLLTRFLTTLARPLDATRTTHRHRLHAVHGALVEAGAPERLAAPAAARAA